MTCAKGDQFRFELLEPRRLLALTINPITTVPLSEGDSAAYEITIQQSPPARHRFHIAFGDGAEYTSSDFDASITIFTGPSHQFRDNGPGAQQTFGGEVTVFSLDNNGIVIDQATRGFAQV